MSHSPNNTKLPRSPDPLTQFLRKEISWLQLGETRMISEVSIVLTYRCPAACAHCLFGCNMKRNETVDLAQAKTLIAAASRQSPPPAVGFTGGEPFLEFDMLLELVEFARRSNMASEVISSSAWCRGREHGREILSALRRKGLVTYCTSVDRYHVRYVAPTRMRDAILAARDLGLRVTINTMADPKRRGQEKAYLAETLDLPAETIDELRVNVLKVVPVGRARKHVRDFVLRDKDLEEGCPFCTQVIALTPEGLAYPCCGMIMGMDPARAGAFVLGRLEGKSVEEAAAMLQDAKRDLFLRLIQVLGPYRILTLLKQRRGEMKVPDRFVGTCDMCMELSGNPAVAEALEELLLQWKHALGQASG